MLFLHPLLYSGRPMGPPILSEKNVQLGRMPDKGHFSRKLDTPFYQDPGGTPFHRGNVKGDVLHVFATSLQVLSKTEAGAGGPRHATSTFCGAQCAKVTARHYPSALCVGFSDERCELSRSLLASTSSNRSVKAGPANERSLSSVGIRTRFMQLEIRSLPQGAT